MSEKSSYSKLALPSVGVTILSLILFIVGQIAVGLTFVFIALLLISGTFIKNRLDSIGAATWALGSVIVWFGFILVAIPLLAVAWGFMSESVQIGVFILGILIIILGFTTEFFDLNEKFLDWLQRTQKRLSKAWTIFKTRFLSSLSARIQFVLSLMLIASFVFNSFTDSVAEQFSDSLWLHPRTIIVYFMLVTFLFQIKELISTLLISFFGFFSILLRGLVRRVLLLPDLLKRVYILMIDLFTGIINRFLVITKFVWRNSQVTGFSGFVLFGTFSLFSGDKTTFAIALLLLLSALAVLLKRNPEFVNRQLTRAQSTTYRSRFWLQKQFRTPKTVTCAACQTEVSPKFTFCRNCNSPLPTCSVCRMKISGGSLVLACSKCNQQGHDEHLQGWFRYSGRIPTCPHCREVWDFAN